MPKKSFDVGFVRVKPILLSQEGAYTIWEVCLFKLDSDTSKRSRITFTFRTAQNLTPKSAAMYALTFANHCRKYVAEYGDGSTQSGSKKYIKDRPALRMSATLVSCVQSLLKERSQILERVLKIVGTSEDLEIFSQRANEIFYKIHSSFPDIIHANVTTKIMGK